MVIQPKIRDYICTTAHPWGCSESVKRQISYTESLGKAKGPGKVLVIGSSTGYGLATRIAAAYGCGSATLGVMFEKAPTARRTATPGWYNTVEFEKRAAEDGLYAKTINGDAFSREIKEEAVKIIMEDLGQVDMVVYSLAAPRRTTEDGTVYKSSLKTVGEPFTNKSLDLRTNVVKEATIFPAGENEVHDTVKVMGGEDWEEWIKVLSEAGVFKKGALTLAYSYIGPELTYPVYHQGTIGMAKQHLYETAGTIEEKYEGVRAAVSVNKALVTQASSAIPIVPLYMAALYKVMKEKGVHEGCIEQMNRLFREKLAGETLKTDEEGRIRLDDWEMREDIQKEVADRWEEIGTDNVKELADIGGYWEDFYQMFGFGFENVDYDQDIELV